MHGLGEVKKFNIYDGSTFNMPYNCDRLHSEVVVDPETDEEVLQVWLFFPLEHSNYQGTSTNEEKSTFKQATKPVQIQHKIITPENYDEYSEEGIVDDDYYYD